MMTQEELIGRIKEIKDRAWGWHINGEVLGIDYDEFIEIMDAALTALRPVSRERVERMRGEWMFKPFYKGTSRGAIECQKCKGAFEGSVKFNFCPNCGAPMTDEAVQMVIERLNAIR